jgi:hypothetical protein
VSEIPERPPALDPQAVQQFVIAGHGDLDAVRAALADEPGLVNACWDWGGGDWETALGGAAHMGRRDIALMLLEHGARLDVFAAAMLGETEIVRATLEAFPALADARGPHGIPLLAHAVVGGEVARGVVDLLEGVAAGR